MKELLIPVLTFSPPLNVITTLILSFNFATFTQAAEYYSISYLKLDALQQIRQQSQQQGIHRLRHFKWKVGSVLPLHYRNDHYKLENSEISSLPLYPSTQWYKVKNNFVLINEEAIIVAVK